MNDVSRVPKNKKFNLWRCSCKSGVETKNWKEIPENPSWKEHAEWDFAPYMDILWGVSSQRK